MFWAKLLRPFSWWICWFSRNFKTQKESTNVVYYKSRKYVIIAMIYSTVKLIKTFYALIKMIEYLHRIVT